MENSMLEKILKVIFLTVIVVIFSCFVFGFILKAMLNYSSVEGSFNLATHALLVGLIFTVIFCTTLILEKLSEVKKVFSEVNTKSH